MSGSSSTEGPEEEVKYEEDVEDVVVVTSENGQEDMVEQHQEDTTTTTTSPFKDHFTLTLPSSAVRFRGTNIQVHELRSSQIQLQEQRTSSQTYLVKKVPNERTCGLNILRLFYTLVSLFFAGILFIFCFQVLLFLFMGLVADIGVTDDASVAEFVSSVASIPIFVYGLASVMALAGGFVVDTWNGHVFLRTVGQWSLVLTEWIALCVYLGIPIVTWIIALFQGTDHWWAITSMTWFCCVAVLFTFYCIAVVWYEVQASWHLLKQMNTTTTTTSRWHMFQSAIQHRQRYQLSGSMIYVRMTNIQQEDQVPKQDSISLYSRMTLLHCCCTRRLYQVVDPPERLYSTEDILGTRQFVTSNTWSLEKIYCSNQRSQSVAIVRGPSALLPGQMRSSLVCSIGGNAIALLLLIALLVWLEGKGVFILFLTILILLGCIPRFRSTFRVYKMYRDVINAQTAELPETESDTDGIYQSYERYRITQPRPWLCWFSFVFEVAILFLWPLITLFVTANYEVGTVFLVVSIISVIRYYLNPAILIKEVGSFEIVNPDEVKSAKSGPYADKEWKAKSRLTSILLQVARGSSRRVWVWIFAIVAFIIFIFAIASLGTSTEDSKSDAEEIVLLPRDNFVYEPTPNLPYPTCRLAKGLEIPFSNSTGLADYAFLAVLAYQPPDLFQDKLDDWFGEGVAKDETDTVREFRQEIKGGQAAVSYHLVSFPGNLAVVVVRGSTTPWEWLTDAQLWGAAAIAGIGRFLLPFGEIWNPILDQLLKAVSWVESENLQEVALYQQTTSFVEALQASGNFSSLHITGQSLGGGISLITGAQTKIPAIAISGPNLKLSRKTFDPSIGKDEINEYLFNVVPERDFIPRIDDLGPLYQNIQCRAPKNSIWGCHSSVRSLCEIMYRCGSFNRPALCDCATKFGYPEAAQFAGESSFTDICGTRRDNIG